MSGETDRTAGDTAARRVAHGLAYLCAHIDEIGTLLATDVVAEGELERLRAALRATSDISGPLNLIHDALLRAGDALGIYGHVRGLQDLALAGIGDEPIEIVYRCPQGRCPRTVPGPEVNPPRCGMTGEKLRWGQL